MMAEKLLHFMNKNGFNVVEVRRAQDLFIKKEVGEMILTRDISELAQLTKAKSVLAGTYVATSNALIINARLIDINTPRILSSYSYEVAMTDEVISLLTGESPF
jgi:TolB-like protein